MNVDSFARRILSLNDHKSMRNREPQKKVQQRLHVKNEKINMATMRKSSFAKINEKRFHFFKCGVSLPFGHPYLSEIRE